MDTTNSFSKATWELQTAFKKSLYGSIYKMDIGSFRLTICSFHSALEQMLNTTARLQRETCENSNAFCKK